MTGEGGNTGTDRALAAQLRLLNRAISTIEEAVFIVDPSERRILACNDAVEEIFGYSPNEVVGRTSTFLYPSPERFQAFAEITEPILADTGIFHGEYEMRRKDGTVFPSGHTITVLEEGEDFRTGVISIVRDLSHIRSTLDVLERTEKLYRQARAQVEQSEHYFRALIESSQDIVTVLDPNDSIRYESPAVSAWLGYSPEELVGRDPFELVHPDDLAQLRELFSTGVLEPGQTASAEFRFRHRDGSWRILDARAVNLVDDPVVRGVIVHSRDVTEQRLTEQSLQKSRERLLFADKMEALGRLAGGIVHDLRNWLFLIQAQAELLGEKVQPGMRRPVEEIQRAVEQGARLVEELGTFGSREREPERVQSVDLNALISRLESSIHQMAGKKVVVSVETVDCPAVIQAEPGDLQQVILNLVNNALDAMPASGRLTLALDHADARPGPDMEDDARTDRYLRLTVEDSGHGMDESIRAKIFEPFFTTKQEGTGLGLANVFAVAHDLGGFVDVWSEPGRGSRFEVYFPQLVTS